MDVIRKIYKEKDEDKYVVAIPWIYKKPDIIDFRTLFNTVKEINWKFKLILTYVELLQQELAQ